MKTLISLITLIALSPFVVAGFIFKSAWMGFSLGMDVCVDAFCLLKK